MGSRHWWYHVNTQRLAEATGHSADFAGIPMRDKMDDKPWKIQGSCTTIKFGGVILLGKMLMSYKLWLIRHKPIQSPRTWERCQLRWGLGSFGTLDFFTCPSASITYTTWLKWVCVGLKIRAASHTSDGKSTSEADESSGYLQCKVSIWEDVAVTLEGVSWALWQRSRRKGHPQDFGPSSGRGQILYIGRRFSIEQQLLGAYTALLQGEPLVKGQWIMIRTLTIKGWVEKAFHPLISAMALTPTLTDWLACRSILPTNHCL